MDNTTQVVEGFYKDKMNETNVTLPTSIYGLNTKVLLNDLAALSKDD